MRKHPILALVTGLSAALALTLVVGAGAQMTPPASAPPAAKTPQAAPIQGQGAPGAPHDAAMKADCEAMMAKHRAMAEKMKAQDATLDALVAEMNAAKTSKAPDAMEKPMAAVLGELVAQRKAQRAMMMEMQPEMMGHMSRHMGMKMHGEMAGMDCPMMKADAAAPMAMEKKPKT
jgi:hypothetical protein